MEGSRSQFVDNYEGLQYTIMSCSTYSVALNADSSIMPGPISLAWR